MYALRLIFTGLISAGVYTVKSGLGFTSSGLGDVTIPSHKLRAERNTYAVHFHNNGVFRQFGSDTVHFRSDMLYDCRNRIKLSDCLFNKKFDIKFFENMAIRSFET